MNEPRNRGVTEARFALTLLTCLLVAIGYVVLLRLSGGKEQAIDAGPDDTSPPIASAPRDDQSPRVLKPEAPDDASIARMPKRSDRTVPRKPSTDSERR